MILKKIISILSVAVFTTGIIAALFFGSLVRECYPDFSTLLFVSSVVFFGGMAYAMMERNIVIGILTIFVTMLIPFIRTMLADYWDWVVFQVHAFWG